MAPFDATGGFVVNLGQFSGLGFALTVIKFGNDRGEVAAEDERSVRGS